MNDADIHTLEQVRAFLDGTEGLELQLQGKDERYAWTERTLRRFRYRRLNKAGRGLLKRYVERVTGLSRAQVTRLLSRFSEAGAVCRQQRTTRPFTARFTQADIHALAELDELHGTLSGPATKKLCERAVRCFAELRYERLATISVAHLYNLRKHRTYTATRRHFDKTKPSASNIGQRRKPQPNGRPGFIRVDTVHQGDLDRIKGVYYINAVDEVTQFEFVLATEKISEHYLLPVLKELIDAFPFQLHSFHADNGSEFINHTVAKLLNKLLIELTKSRPRHSNDNALAESKNAAVVRKHMGYAHIAQKWAPRINTVLREHLNPYINFHRPCFFPVLSVDDKGRQRKRYPYQAMMTPYDKLQSLPEAERYLKVGIDFEQLDAQAFELSDNQAAEQLQQAKRELYNDIFGRRKRVA